ncbi:hypothetical protein KMZ30_07225 [Phycicoccus sp. KQZ13P-1]|uniref:hypothetical protein n=1 Tax=Phycicoccus mangrovi TaxID=2840470 RepID=UPI001C0078DC|nr:hypothetical protein [Phycicoccus mangrovi]MBT9255362.1 hypothetical protein [Phycicoccus mangrovi]
MTRSLWLPGADRSSHYFGDDYPGLSQKSIDKLVAHSTETDKRWGCPGYQGGATAPTITVNPWPGYQQTWQHFPANTSARALLNPTWTPVSENKDDVAQVEIIGYSEPNLGKARGCYLPDLPLEGLEYVARILRWYHDEWGVRLVRPATWPWYRVSNEAAFREARMSSGEYDRYAGVLAHLHVSGNEHRDVAIDIDRLLSIANGRAGSGAGHTTPPPVSAGGTSHTVPEEDIVASIEDLERIVRQQVDRGAKNIVAKIASEVWDDYRTPTKRSPIGLLQQAAGLTEAVRAAIREEVANLPEGGTVTEATIETALRNVFGSLGTTPGGAE